MNIIADYIIYIKTLGRCLPYILMLGLYVCIYDPPVLLFKSDMKFCPLTKKIPFKVKKSRKKKLAHYADYSYENCM